MDMTAEQASKEDRKYTFWVPKSMDMTVEQAKVGSIDEWAGGWGLGGLAGGLLA